jgi:hypothetical protein
MEEFVVIFGFPFMANRMTSIGKPTDPDNLKLA